MDAFRDERGARAFLRRARGGIVLDVSGQDTLPLLRACDAEKASYLNTCLSDRRVPMLLVVEETMGKAKRYRGAPHVLASGMNPGVVNVWACRAIRRHGVPRQIVHFEYDDSMTPDRWRPVLTWSPADFLQETLRSAAGYAADQCVVELPRCSFHALEPLAPVLDPLFPGERHPQGLLVLHEENILVPRRYGGVSKFVYALHPRTIRHLVSLLGRRGTLKESDFHLADNARRRLAGADLIGVMLDYGNRRVYLYNRLENAAVEGTSATCAQVAVGLRAGLSALLEERLKPGIHFPGDLLGTAYERVALSELVTVERVLSRRGGRWRPARALTGGARRPA